MSTARAESRIVRLALGCYPKQWRSHYGDELVEVFTDCGVGWATTCDVIRAGLRERAAANPASRLRVLALLVAVTVEVLAVRWGISDNVLWLPTSPVSAAALLVLAGAAATCVHPANTGRLVAVARELRSDLGLGSPR